MKTLHFNKKKLLSLVLSLAMLIQMTMPVLAVSPEGTPPGVNTCTHHMTHTDLCGYREGTKGTKCGHVHDESCYTTKDSDSEITSEGTSSSEAAGGKEESTPIPTESPVESSPAAESAAESGPDAESAAESGPDAESAAESGSATTESVAESNSATTEGAAKSGHISTESVIESRSAAIESPGESGSVTDKILNCQHIHDAVCGYVEAVVESPCTFECESCQLPVPEISDTMAGLLE